MDGCVLFHLGANAGTYGRSFEIHKHDDWPDLYKTCNIKTRCLTAPPPSVIAESIDEASFNLTDSLISGNETTGEHIPGQLPAADKDAKEIVLLLLQKRAKNADKGAD
jgi:hypothetical protein